MGGGEVSRNLEPKRGVTENFGRVQRGTTQIGLENEDMVGGGSLQRSSIPREESAKFHLV